MNEPMRIVFAGGGTGGHLFPGLAVAEELRRRQPACRIVFAGSERGIERQILQQADCEHVPLAIESSAGLLRHPLRFLKNYWRSKSQSRGLLDEIQPHAVIGLGGFASVPIVNAAHARKIPVLLLEQNVVPGRATRWLARKADRVCHAFDECRDAFRKRGGHVVTGNPVRQEIARLYDRDDARGECSPRTILVLGGSQGSEAVNRLWIAAAERLTGRLLPLRILHQSGPRDVGMLRERYDRAGLTAIVEPFFEILPTLYRQADLVVSRAGATTLAELACAGLPAILIPYPGAIGDHQAKNARHFERHGAARVVEQTSDLRAAEEKLVLSLGELLDADLTAMRRSMRELAQPQAAANVVEELLSVLSMHD